MNSSEASENKEVEDCEQSGDNFVHSDTLDTILAVMTTEIFTSYMENSSMSGARNRFISNFFHIYNVMLTH